MSRIKNRWWKHKPNGDYMPLNVHFKTNSSYTTVLHCLLLQDRCDWSHSANCEAFCTLNLKEYISLLLLVLFFLPAWFSFHHDVGCHTTRKRVNWLLIFRLVGEIGRVLGEVALQHYRACISVNFPGTSTFQLESSIRTNWKWYIDFVYF